MGILLFIIARISLYILEFPLIIFSTVYRALGKDKAESINEYYYRVAYSADQHSGVVGWDFLDLTMLKNKYADKRFGNPDWTISYIIATNQRVGNLTKFGQFWAWFLNWIDFKAKEEGTTHLQKAIDYNENRHK